MARDGYRIFDSDTHVGPDARILADYLSAAEQDRLRSWEAYKSTDRHGRETYTMGQRRYRRRLGMAASDEAERVHDRVHRREAGAQSVATRRC